MSIPENLENKLNKLIDSYNKQDAIKDSNPANFDQSLSAKIKDCTEELFSDLSEHRQDYIHSFASNPENVSKDYQRIGILALEAEKILGKDNPDNKELRQKIQQVIGQIQHIGKALRQHDVLHKEIKGGDTQKVCSWIEKNSIPLLTKEESVFPVKLIQKRIFILFNYPVRN